MVFKLIIFSGLMSTFTRVYGSLVVSLCMIFTGQYSGDNFDMEINNFNNNFTVIFPYNNNTLKNIENIKNITSRGVCKSTLVPVYLIKVIPYILRAIQGLNFVYFKKKCWPHIGNSGRFIVSAVSITFAYLYANGNIY